MHAGYEPVCLVLWTSTCLCLFKRALAHSPSAFYVYCVDLGIHTAPSCKKPTHICSVPELVACGFYQVDLGSAADPYAADSLQFVNTQPASVVIQDFDNAYENPYMPTDTICSDILNVHSDRDSLLSFAKEFRGLVTGFLLLRKGMHVQVNGGAAHSRQTASYRLINEHIVGCA